jgi:transcription factor C subunit 6
MSVGWSSQNESPLVADTDHNVSLYKIRGIPAARNAMVLAHRGPVWVSAIVTGTLAGREVELIRAGYRDKRFPHYGCECERRRLGQCRLDAGGVLPEQEEGKCPRGLTDRQSLFFWRIIEIDYDKVTGHYRLTDDFAPEVSGRPGRTPD